MNRYERVESALQGKTVDRAPVSAWGHFYHREHSAVQLAESMLSFQEKYDWDFMKVNSRASYHAEGWGYTYGHSGKPEDRPVCTDYPIKSLGDWEKIKPIPSDQGALGEHLKAINLIREGLKGKVPFIMTVFSPLMVAGFLSNLRSDFQNLKDVAQMIKQHYQENPAVIREALSAIAETFAGFVRKLSEMGVNGIYFATNMASSPIMTPEEYSTIARPYDLVVLEASRKLPFNIFHICQNYIHLKELADYPVQAIHWDTNGEGNPSLADGMKIVPMAVAGGVDRKVLAMGHVTEVKTQVRDAIFQTKGRHFLLSPSCSAMLAQTPESNLRAMRDAIEQG